MGETNPAVPSNDSYAKPRQKSGSAILKKESSARLAARTAFLPFLFARIATWFCSPPLDHSGTSRRPPCSLPTRRKRLPIFLVLNLRNSLECTLQRLYAVACLSWKGVDAKGRPWKQSREGRPFSTSTLAFSESWTALRGVGQSPKERQSGTESVVLRDGFVRQMRSKPDWSANSRCAPARI